METGQNEQRRQGEAHHSQQGILDYRLERLEKSFDTFREDFNEKLDKLTIEFAPIVLMEYRIRQLENWRNKILAGLGTIGIAVLGIAADTFLGK